MDADIVGNMINHLDQHTITLSGNNARSRKLPIDSQYGFRLAQSGHILQPYLPSNNNREQKKWRCFRTMAHIHELENDVLIHGSNTNIELVVPCNPCMLSNGDLRK